MINSTSKIQNVKLLALILLVISFSVCQLVTIEELFPFSSKNYRVRFDDSRLSFDSSKTNNNHELIEIAVDGRQYVCQIPETAEKKSAFFFRGTEKEKNEPDFPIIQKQLPDKNIIQQISDSAAKVEELKTTILKNLAETFKTYCIYRLQGWWNYEFCYNKHIRQFHANLQNVVEDQFFLGHLSVETDKKFNSNEEIESSGGGASKISSLLGSAADKSKKNAQKKPIMGFRAGPLTVSKEEITQREAKAKENMKIHLNKEVPELSYVSFDFNNGTVCDISKQPRTTEVRLSCLSKSMIQKITNLNAASDGTGGATKPLDHDKMFVYPDAVTEPSTCHYLLKVYVATLCDVEGFGAASALTSSTGEKSTKSTASSSTEDKNNKENPIICIPRSHSTKQITIPTKS